jgi:hypothetical protein
MDSAAADLAHRLARDAEAVCRHYLSNGRRAGNYWLVGDTGNNPGRSLYVRLRGPASGKGAAGKWTDAATGEHGDLLDLIAANRGIDSLQDALVETRRLLGLVQPERPGQPSVPAGSPEAARRLFAIAEPIAGTVAETYLRARGLAVPRHVAGLRFHPRCYYRPDEGERAARAAWPALIAAVTDHIGTITGAHRTWLDPIGHAKAPVATPRRTMGHLLGNAVRFGAVRDVMAAGEGIETMLSLRAVAPDRPTAAALSASHLAALVLPATLRRLYVVQDNDPAGRWAAQALADRARHGDIEALILVPALGDLNDDLRRLGVAALAAAFRVQLAPEDVARFWRPVGNERSRM